MIKLNQKKLVIASIAAVILVASFAVPRISATQTEYNTNFLEIDLQNPTNSIVSDITVVMPNSNSPTGELSKVVVLSDDYAVKQGDSLVAQVAVGEEISKSQIANADIIEEKDENGNISLTIIIPEKGIATIKYVSDEGDAISVTSGTPLLSSEFLAQNSFADVSVASCTYSDDLQTESCVYQGTLNPLGVNELVNDANYNDLALFFYFMYSTVQGEDFEAVLATELVNSLSQGQAATTSKADAPKTATNTHLTISTNIQNIDGIQVSETTWEIITES